MATFRPADFSRVIQLGHAGTKVIGGVNRDAFVADYKLHYTTQKRTLTQQYQLIGTRLDETQVVITRHDARNIDATLAQLGTTTYSILDVSPDEGAEAIRYDYLTIKRVDGHA